jgi:hypothetical protein
VASRSACWEVARTLPDRIVRLMASEDYNVVNRGIEQGKEMCFSEGGLSVARTWTVYAVFRVKVEL